MKFHSRKTLLVLALVVSAVLSTAERAVAQVWTAGPPAPTVFARAQGTWFPANSRFYVLGGRTSDLAGSDLFSPSEYDPATNGWALKSAVFPSNEVNNMAGGVLIDGGQPFIFCVGGSAAGATTATPTVRRYDPVADVITTVTTDPWPGTANTLPGAGVVYNNKLYIFGGFTISVGMSTQIWEFNPAAAAGSKWTLKTAVLPVPMGYIPAALVGNLIYIGGGSLWVPATATLADSANSFVYDPVADLIAPITNTPRATGETRAVQYNGQMWVLGGGRIAPNPSNQVDAYSPGSNSWSLAPSFVTARRNAAIDRDAAGNIYLAGGYAPTAQTSNFEIFRQLSVGFCFGDGTGTACPCGNAGAAGNGCASSINANGANLTTSGTPSLAADTLTLLGSGMPNSSALYFQGVTQVGAGAGAVFGDGLRCAGGTIVRLKTVTNVASNSQYPEVGDPSVSVKGMVGAPGTRTYQSWYRNAATFCTTATFNLTNGVLVTWTS
jgi:hypothetical protein